MRSTQNTATIQDVARACGVSPATVSLVLNNSTRPIRAETREMVLRTVRELRYRPNPAARPALAATRSNTIGVASGKGGASFLNSSHHSEILKGIVTVADAAGQSILILHEQILSSTLGDLRRHVDGRCDGLVLLSYVKAGQLIEALKARGIPLVLTGGVTDDPDVSHADVDNTAGVRAVMSRLLGMGHRRIGLICGEGLFPFDRRRRDAYRDALTGAGLPADPALVADVGASGRRDPDGASGYTVEGGRERTHLLLDRCGAEPPTAIFCTNDRMAVGALGALRERGLSVPADVSVVGFDDEAVCLQTDPPLATLRQPHREIGEWAARRLLREIEGEPGGEQMLLPGELIERASLGLPPPAPPWR